MARPWTHRDYFRRFRLNVEQYGEILIAQVFHGAKKGDGQPCYDVETSIENIRRPLLDAGMSRDKVEKCLSNVKDGIVRIEVKSKLARTPKGRASVIHCSDNKIDGKRTYRPATHFAVVLFDGAGNGQAEIAWLFSSAVARTLRKMETTSRYIPVSSLKNAPRKVGNAIIDISGLINEAASKPLLLGDS